MSYLDDELRKALAPEDPPEGFADRVVARIAEAEREPALAAPRASRWWTAAAAAALVVAAITWVAVPSNQTPNPGPSGTIATAPSTGQPRVEPPPPDEPISTTAPERGEELSAISEQHDPPIKMVSYVKRARPVRRAVPRRDALTEEEWKAAQQFMLAMSITNEKLKPVQRYLPSTHEGPKT
jgi:hypothetical protein